MGGPNVSMSKRALQILGIILVLMAAAERRPPFSAFLAILGLAVWLSALRAQVETSGRQEMSIAAVAGTLLALGVFGIALGDLPHSLSSVQPLLLGLAGIATISGLLVGRVRTSASLLTLACVASVAVQLSVLTFSELNSDSRSDVHRMHTAAGQALLAGENPYSGAVQVVSGNPHHPPGTIIEGYPYTPVVLLTYGLVGGFTDPRLVSTLALLGIVSWLGRGALTKGPGQVASLAAMVLIAFTPLVSEVWFMSWTEPLTLVLFLGAALTWKKSWFWSGLLFGLALASKQYLVFLAPLLALHRDEGWLGRSAIAGGTAAATILVGLIPNPTAFVNATIGNLVDIGFRPDTQSLPGAAHALGWTLILPSAVWLAISFCAGILISRSSTQPSQFIGKSALVVAVPFLLGMAFPNYWFLVALLLTMSMVTAAGEDATGQHLAPVS